MCKHGLVTTDYGAMNTGLLLYLPYRYLEEQVLEAANAEDHRITASQARVFQRISEGGSRIVDLAAATSLTKQSVGFIVDQLVRSGHVTREPDPLDARARLVTITDQGRAMIETGRQVVDRVEREWQAVVGEDEYRVLRRALRALSEYSDRHAHESLPSGVSSGAGVTS